MSHCFFSCLLESGLRLIKTAVVFCAGGFLFTLQAQTVRFAINEGGTAAGNIDVTLRPDVAPMTVANFLSYVNAGAYNNTIIHRSVPNFVIQAGGLPAPKWHHGYRDADECADYE